MASISASAVLIIIMTLMVMPHVETINTAEAAPGTASTTTLTMTSGQDNLDLNLTVRDTDGTFATSKTGEEATFDITTNNYTGYSLTISAASDAGTLVNTTDGSVLNSINAIMGRGEFDTTSNNGKWGFKPSKYNSINNEAYIPAPTTAGVILDKTTSANATANSYTIGLGARIDYSTTYGTYTGNFILAAVANPVPYSITFTDTSNDATVAGMPKTVAGDVGSDQVELPTNIPTRANFTFAGWCDTTPSVNAATGTMTCSGNTYQASTSSTPVYVGIDQTAAMNSIALYALWTVVPSSLTHDVTVNFSGNISAVDFVAAGQTTQTVTTSGAKATLVRGVAYTMTTYTPSENEFRSYALNSSSYGTLSSTTTNPATFTTNASSSSAVITVTSNTCLNGIAGIMQNISNASNYCTGAVGAVVDSRDSQAYTVGKLKDGNIWMLQNLKLGKNSTTLALTTADSDVPSGGFTLTNKSSDGKFTNAGNYNNDNSQYYCTDAYGCYYNWYTATASSGSSATTSGSVDYSICPKGWTLPTGGSGGQFQTLTNLYGGTGSAGATAMLVDNPTTTTENTSGLAAPSLLLGGYYYSSGADLVGSYGYYWSRTAYSARYGYSLGIDTTSVNPTYYGSKYSGRSVRCLLK